MHAFLLGVNLSCSVFWICLYGFSMYSYLRLCSACYRERELLYIMATKAKVTVATSMSVVRKCESKNIILTNYFFKWPYPTQRSLSLSVYCFSQSRYPCSGYLYLCDFHQVKPLQRCSAVGALITVTVTVTVTGYLFITTIPSLR